MVFYKGYSTFEFERNKSLKILDIELVKLDILNQIFTRRGERVMMPNYGSIVPDVVFEPLDEETLDILEQDLTAVVNFDPRVDLLEFSLNPAVDENRVCGRYVDTAFDDRGAYQQIAAMMVKIEHYGFEFFFLHASVHDADARVGN